ncbi:hypothetical protein D3C78_1047350 [compost metagenome]
MYLITCERQYVSICCTIVTTGECCKHYIICFVPVEITNPLNFWFKAIETADFCILQCICFAIDNNQVDVAYITKFICFVTDQIDFILDTVFINIVNLFSDKNSLICCVNTLQCERLANSQFSKCRLFKWIFFSSFCFANLEFAVFVRKPYFFIACYH